MDNKLTDLVKNLYEKVKDDVTPEDSKDVKQSEHDKGENIKLHNPTPTTEKETFIRLPDEEVDPRVKEDYVVKDENRNR